MSSEPPSGNRPTGPPSGPLSGRGPEPPPEPRGGDQPTVTGDQAGPQPPRPSGPTEPPPPPPPPPPPAPPTGDEGGGPPARRPWWRSRTALVAAAVVVAAALAVVFLRMAGGGYGEIYLQSATAPGQDPFTPSASTADTTVTPAVPAGSRTVTGSTRGIYGGVLHQAGCDLDGLMSHLTGSQEKRDAFARALKTQPGELDGFLRGLTPVQLRADTHVTDHGYRNGDITGFQAVLQAGTVVLADRTGLPRVRCAGGNPLSEASTAAKESPKKKGDTWPAYRDADVVVVTQADSELDAFVLYDFQSGDWFERPVGTHGEKDRPVATPSNPLPTTKPPATPAPGHSAPSAPSGTTPTPAPTTPTKPNPSPSPTTPPTTPPSPPSPAYAPQQAGRHQGTADA
ncbi:hypothetical protein GCM10010218_46020 [Streptomyces mashuensis]|uniref:DUF6777 domain-containing protein n=1 Tax=Streptomyces mashuensis TaxID=33904 RepID=A0A919B619_9ACTN|nr:DUF6777 domain-containing protein [Streptomyces mashuensis]GHF59324.1 hypothetical protein GCM10010218_46020 [Streptomyces mashuensis]